MTTVTLEAEVRSGVGKGPARKLRQRQRIPAIVYGGRGGPLAVSVSPKALLKVLGTGAGENVLIELRVVGGPEATGMPRMVLLKELQRDPVLGGALHADFLEIFMERKIRVEVPVVVAGQPVGVKAKGGMLEQTLRQVAIECLPTQIPDRLSLDVSALDVGDVLHVKDLVAGEGIRILEEGERVVASVRAPAAEEAPPVVVEEKPAEPELVRKEGKEKEKEEAGEATGRERRREEAGPKKKEG